MRLGYRRRTGSAGKGDIIKPQHNRVSYVLCTIVVEKHGICVVFPRHSHEGYKAAMMVNPYGEKLGRRKEVSHTKRRA
jgi:hypothetical protein